MARQETGVPVKRYDDTSPNSSMQGDVMACCLYAGTGVGKITEVRSAGALVKDLADPSL